MGVVLTRHLCPLKQARAKSEDRIRQNDRIKVERSQKKQTDVTSSHGSSRSRGEMPWTEAAGGGRTALCGKCTFSHSESLQDGSSPSWKPFRMGSLLSCQRRTGSMVQPPRGAQRKAGFEAAERAEDSAPGAGQEDRESLSRSLVTT